LTEISSDIDVEYGIYLIDCNRIKLELGVKCYGLSVPPQI
jgi:hypothetical protein